MKIGTPAELERALHERERLEKAEAGSPEAKRRDDLEAAIKAYYTANAGKFEKGRPKQSDFDRPKEGHPGKDE